MHLTTPYVVVWNGILFRGDITVYTYYKIIAERAFAGHFTLGAPKKWVISSTIPRGIIQYDPATVRN